MRDEVAEFLAHLSIEKGLSQNTISAYQGDLDRYFEIIDGIEITEENLNQFIAAERKSGKAEASIARQIVALRNFAAFMSKERGIASSISEYSPPKLPKRLPKAVDVSTISKILDIYNNSEDIYDIRDRAILEVLYSAGLRISELTSLNFDSTRDFLENKTLKVVGKGGKERIVPIGIPAVKAIEEYVVRARNTLLKKYTERALFINSRGNRISRQSVWQIIQEAAERAGINEHISPHTFRHSFATHLLDGGADIRVVQELLGHASVTTTQVYTLITIDKLRESYATSHPRAR